MYEDMSPIKYFSANKTEIEIYNRLVQLAKARQGATENCELLAIQGFMLTAYFIHAANRFTNARLHHRRD